MYCERNPGASRQKIGENLLDRSVAYEMIHDFGVAAFVQVVQQYQSNMASKLAEIQDCTEQDDVAIALWGLQFIRNCSVQLGIIGVTAVCAELADEVLECGLSRLNCGQLERSLATAVDALNQISTA